MDVAAEVVEQMLGRAKRLFGVDVPSFPSRSFEQHVEVPRIGQGSGFAWEVELALIEGLFEKLQELSAKDDAKGFDGEQEVVARGDPAVLIERKHSFWKNTVEVKMGLQLLIPGMQNQGKAWGSLKTSLGKFQQGLGNGLKQELEEQFFVYKDQGVKFVAQGENEMERSHGKEP